MHIFSYSYDRPLRKKNKTVTPADNHVESNHHTWGMTEASHNVTNKNANNAQVALYVNSLVFSLGVAVAY